jgi:hypothetical protein
LRLLRKETQPYRPLRCHEDLGLLDVDGVYAARTAEKDMEKVFFNLDRLVNK